MACEQRKTALILDDDELYHYQMVSPDVGNRLSLAEQAAVITLNGLISLDKPPRINDIKALETFLLAKSAKDIRFAAIGVKLGYYSSASAVLRSALESLSFTALFSSDESQIANWFRSELSGVTKEKPYKKWKKQTNKARKALLEKEQNHNQLTMENALAELVWDANKSIHSTIHGLAKEFGLDIADFFPDDLQHACEKYNGDIERALNHYVLQAKFGKNMSSIPTQSDEPIEEIPIVLSGRYDETVINGLALFTFYIGHRLLDFTNDLFEINDQSFKKDFEKWHKAIKEA